MRVLSTEVLDWAFAPSLDAKPVRVRETDPRDLEDIRSVLQGNPDHYARIIARYQGTLGDYMWRFSRIPAERDRLVHDVFVSAYFGLAKYRGDAPLLHWLRKIATRVGYRHWKQKSKENARKEMSIEPYLEDLAGESQTRHPDERTGLLYAAMEGLRPRDRLTLTLIYFEEMSTREAAKTLGWTETMVRVQTHRARRRLEKLMSTLVNRVDHET